MMNDDVYYRCSSVAMAEVNISPDSFALSSLSPLLIPWTFSVIIIQC